jgi:hypothetical protein
MLKGPPTEAAKTRKLRRYATDFSVSIAKPSEILATRSEFQKFHGKDQPHGPSSASLEPALSEAVTRFTTCLTTAGIWQASMERAAMTNDDERRLSTGRRSSEDRRTGADTRSDDKRGSIGERRSIKERRSGLDRRSSTAADASPMNKRRGKD